MNFTRKARHRCGFIEKALRFPAEVHLEVHNRVGLIARRRYHFSNAYNWSSSSPGNPKIDESEGQVATAKGHWLSWYQINM